MDGRNPAPVDRWFIRSHYIICIYIYIIIYHILYHIYIYYYIIYIYTYHHIIYHYTPDITIISYIYLIYHIIYHRIPYIYTPPWYHHYYILYIYITIISPYAPLYITFIAPVFPEAFRGDRIDAMQVKEAIRCHRHVFAACLWSPQRWINGGWSPHFIWIYSRHIIYVTIYIYIGFYRILWDVLRFHRYL